MRVAQRIFLALVFFVGLFSSLVTSSAIAQAPGLQVYRNNLPADGTLQHPTAIAGETRVKIASFVGVNRTGEAIALDAVLATSSPVAKFQNLFLAVGPTTVSQTQAMLRGGTSYLFPKVQTVNPKEAFVLDVYADAKTYIKPHYPATALSCGLYGTGLKTGIRYGVRNFSSGPKVLVLGGGLLNIRPSANSPLPGPVIRGTEGVEVVRYKLSAQSEDISLKQFALKAGGNCTLNDFNATTLKVNGVSVGSSVFDHDLTARFYGLNLLVPKGSSAEIVVFVEIPSSAASGNDFHFLLDLPGIQAMGGTSASQVTVAAANYPSGTFTILCTNLKAAKAADSPSGMVTPGFLTVLGKIHATNANNPGGNITTLKSFEVVTSGEVSDIRVYRNIIGNSWTAPDAVNSEIEAGATALFIVTGNTLAVSGSTVGVVFKNFVFEDGCGKEFTEEAILPSTFIF